MLSKGMVHVQHPKADPAAEKSPTLTFCVTAGFLLPIKTAHIPVPPFTVIIIHLIPRFNTDILHIQTFKWEKSKALHDEKKNYFRNVIFIRWVTCCWSAVSSPELSPCNLSLAQKEAGKTKKKQRSNAPSNYTKELWEKILLLFRFMVSSCFFFFRIHKTKRTTRFLCRRHFKLHKS